MNHPTFYRYKLIIAYDGTEYGGWQVQPNSTSIQFLVQQALQTITREKVPLTGAGRTDAGVHAEGQCAHFDTLHSQDLFSLQRRLNSVLPSTIRIKEVMPVPTTFHARYNAIGKVYHYHLSIGQVLDPFVRLYRWHLFQPVDVSLLKEAASYFVGEHDFTAFANEPSRGAAARDAVRMLSRLDVVHHGDEVCLQFEGNGFLYRMVRNITGTLVRIAQQKASVNSIPIILASKDRRQAGTSAPARGLFLVKVLY